MLFSRLFFLFLFFFFNDPATTEIYTLSLHDALPIFGPTSIGPLVISTSASSLNWWYMLGNFLDRKSTRLNSSHSSISYAVFCLKKKKKKTKKNDKQIYNTNTLKNDQPKRYMISTYNT